MDRPPPPPASIRAVLESNLATIRSAVAAAAARAGRDPGTVTIVAASKTVAAEVLALLPALGVRELGENRVQEAEPKVRALSDLDLRWNMIGGLQTNKVRRALDLFHRIQSVDREAVLAALSREAERRGRAVDCLIQVNVSGEASKGGYALAEVASAVRRARSLPGLRVTGLMAIPAPAEDPERSRPAFRALREARGDLADLSMGMSGDYAVAIEEGATMVRLGSALFGGLPASCFGRAASAGAA